MKTIGLIGGMSYESTINYYKFINQMVNEKLGGINQGEIIINSVNFEEIEQLQRNNDWDKLNKIMLDKAKSLKRAGADFIAVCANTMHLCVPYIEDNFYLPVIHIADATGEMIKELGLKKVGLLGTSYTMTKDFYKKRINDKFGIEIIIPSKDKMQYIDDVIYKELSLGKILDSSREEFKKMINKLKDQGAEGIILGCTEIPLLISDKDADIPIFNTTKIHSEVLVKEALK